MAWNVELDPAAKRELDKLDPQTARRILMFLYDRVTTLNNPRSIGEALKGSRFGEFWKYRVGDYRIISRIEDNALRILVVRIGNRREVYKSPCPRNSTTNKKLENPPTSPLPNPSPNREGAMKNQSAAFPHRHDKTRRP
jgi:mRNA interferase RelE/StbE